MKTSRPAWIALGIISAISAALHLYRISYPSQTVFDEAHFATYAADYVKYKPFFDIHPPLGKLIYAAAIPLAHPEPLGNTDFIAFTKNTTGTVYYPTNIPYGSFPYVALRLVSALFSLALIVSFYFFLRSIGVSEVGALLGTFFVAFENSLLLETKLILLNGMYLTFGFAALALWFIKKPVAAGFSFALSLGVKLIGIVFIGPILLSRMLVFRTPGLKKFFLTVIIVFLAISFLNFFFFSPAQILSFAKSIGMKFPTSLNARSTDLLAYAASTIVPWSGYIIGGSQAQQSSWYLWPFMRGTMVYFSGVGNLILTGNPVVWYGSTLAILLGIIFMAYKLIRRRNSSIVNIVGNPSSILLTGYFIALLPFFTIVRRGTFLYHYFPALLFAIGMLAYLISDWLKLKNVGDLTSRQWIYVIGIVTLTLAGFIVIAPLTYGL